MKGLEAALGMSLPIDFEKAETLKFYDELCVKNHVACE